MTIRTYRTLAAAFVFGLLATPSATFGQVLSSGTKLVVYSNYSLSGSSAWNTARLNKFTFSPRIFSAKQQLSSPADGVNTRLYDGGELIASVSEGIAVVYPPSTGSRTVVFDYFGYRMLAKGWSVVSVQLYGSYVWDRPPVQGSQNLNFSFRVTAYAGKSYTRVSINSLTLRGPSGQSYSAAFTGNP